MGKGTPVLAATDGRIVDRKDDTSTATGRYLALRANDGNYVRYLHLNSSAVHVGALVNRGDLIAYSGASGNGQESFYGPHVHVSMWVGTTPLQAGYANSVDFENYVGNAPTTPQPTSQEDSVEAIVSAPNGIVVHLRPGGKINFESAQQYNTFRDQIAFLRNAGATDVMALPPLASVPSVTWDTFSFLARYIGAPI